MNTGKLILYLGVTFIGGCLAGWGVCSYILGKKYDQELEEIREVVRQGLAEQDEETEDDIQEEVKEELAQETEYSKDEIERAAQRIKDRQQLRKETSKYRGKYVIHENEGLREASASVDKPVIIDVETYEDEMEQDDWDKLEYTFYAHRTEQCPNGLLIDNETGLKVSDPVGDIGEEALDVLRNISEGSDGVVYVRNPILGCDIMVDVSWDELTDEEREAMEDIGDANEEGGVKG